MNKGIKIFGLLVLVFVIVFITSFVSATDEPKLISVTDSLGNIQTNSWATTGRGDWKSELRTDPIHDLYCSNCIIKIGDKITFTIMANQGGLEYRCYDTSTGNANNEFNNWSTSNTCEWTVKKEDYGQSTNIMISIRNSNGLDYMGNGQGDDYTYMIYKVEENSSTIVTPLPTQQGATYAGETITAGSSTSTSMGETNTTAEQPVKQEPPIEVPVEKACDICPSGCQLINDSSNCGSCVCSTNYGFCYSEGVRYNINNTNVYCLGGILLKQKENNIECQNNFECVSNFCSNGKCYDISSQVKENTSMINRILNWFKRLFRF